MLPLQNINEKYNRYQVDIFPNILFPNTYKSRKIDLYQSCISIFLLYITQKRIPPTPVDGIPSMTNNYQIIFTT